MSFREEEFQEAIGQLSEALERVQQYVEALQTIRFTGYITVEGSDKSRASQEWVALCPYHGEIARSDMTLEGHAFVVAAWEAHEEEHRAGINNPESALTDRSFFGA